MPREVSRMGLQGDSTVYPDCHLHMSVVTYMRVKVSLNIICELRNMRKRQLNVRLALCNW